MTMIQITVDVLADAYMDEHFHNVATPATFEMARDAYYLAEEKGVSSLKISRREARRIGRDLARAMDDFRSSHKDVLGLAV